MMYTYAYLKTVEFSKYVASQGFSIKILDFLVNSTNTNCLRNTCVRVQSLIQDLNVLSHMRDTWVKQTINVIICELFYVFACSSHLRDTWIINTDDEIVDITCNVIEYDLLYSD